MSLFISDAHAAAAGAPQGGGTEMLVMVAVFVLAFYFLILRPQSKRSKEHKELMSSIAKNDEVLTAGGLVGKVAKIAEDKDFMVVALNDNHEVVVQKSSVTAVLPKGTIKSL